MHRKLSPWPAMNATSHTSLSSAHFAFLCTLLILSNLCMITALNSTCIGVERLALLAIKSNLNNTSLWLSSWTGPDCCNWKGITCDTANHVSTLNLHYPYPQDPALPALGPSMVSPSLSLLTHLTSLDLSLNNFAGAAIPNFIASLHNLQNLNLSYTRFNGTIPNLGNLTNLRSLDIHSTPGGIYSLLSHDLQWLSNTPLLHYLDLSGVDLNYPNWSHDINMLSSLSVLNLKSANLGQIPATLSHINLTSLTVLDLSSNYLNSSIPSWLFNISSLMDVRFSASGLHGDIPYTLGGLSKLQHLDLSMNYLTGEIPQSLGNLSHLEYLDLTSNQIQGGIPESIRNLRRLRFLDVSINQISGIIPQGVEDMKMLEHLSLAVNSISGCIPEGIGNLSKLSQLRLSLNDISGLILETIGKLGRLQWLDISFNHIDGQIPQSIGNLSLLQEAVMSNNNISGQMPKTMGNLFNLNHLELQKNNISGSIPSTLGNLCNLEHLELTENNIGGSITELVEGFNRCIKPDQGGLIRLLLGRNNFSGMVPEALGQLSSLVSLDLSSNSFVGSLTEAHFAKLANLSGLDLSFNSLAMRVSDNWVPPFNATGIRLCACRMGPSFPAWLRTQKSLSDICLSDSGISGSIPDWLWDSIYFYESSFNLSHNNLTGQLPISVGGFMFNIFDVSDNSLEGPVPQLSTYVLTYVHLSNNLFSGAIPQTFASAVSNLQVLSLSHNRINGSIPNFFCNLTGLRVLDLSSNGLSGGIPYCWDNSSSLSIIDFSDNYLTGHIPISFGSLASLQSLHLSRNSLHGGIPSSLGNCNKLVTLDLARNYLFGSIPKWIGEKLSLLKILILRQNLFDGSIPVQLSGLAALQVLDLSHNNLSGNLPSSLRNLSSMLGHPGSTSLDKYNFYFYVQGYSSYYFKETILIIKSGNNYVYSTVVLSLLTSIDLSSNNFSGEIPEEITNLSGLLFLNLSNNHLTGEMPQSISALAQLESLDLSMNYISGRIPPSLASLSFLNQLNLSYNNLSGRIPPGTQLQSFDSSVFEGNPYMCGPPLPGNCPNGTLTPESHIAEQGGERDTDVYIGFAPGFIVGFLGLMAATMLKQERREYYFESIDRVCNWVYKVVLLLVSN